MLALVINDISDRLDRLEAVLDQARSAHVAAVFVLGNVVSGTARRAANAARRSQARLSAELKGELVHEATADRAIYTRAAELLGALGVPVYVIPGEQDAPLITLREALVNDRGASPLHFVHRGASPLGGTDVVAGFGGALATDPADAQVLVQFRDWEARMFFEHLHSFSPAFQLAQRRIFLFAAPAPGEHIDVLDGDHVGKPVLKQIIRQYQPHLVCCGGPPTGRGVEIIDGTLMVNPGSLAAGSYAIVDLDHLTGRLFRLLDLLPQAAALFRSIIVALDGSPEATHALELAAGLARATSAKLTLLHAWDPVRAGLEDPYVDVTVGQRIERGEQLLEQAASSVADLAPMRDLVEGPAADAIVRVADVQQADLIVMGGRGHGPLRALLGGVSSRVLQRAACPVLIARKRPQNAALVEQAAPIQELVA